MATADLAARMGVSVTAVANLERNERSGGIRLGTLRRAADALDCDLVYALVPRQPLDQMIDQRARQLAVERLRPVAHSMALEGQAVTDAATLDQLAEQAAEIRDRPGLWRNAAHR
jgi:predicted DNA-binding mobile mystery protein A